MESESHSVVSDSLWPRGLYSPWNSPGQNTGVGNLSLLQGIFLITQGSNPGLPHCRQSLYQLSHKLWCWTRLKSPLDSKEIQPVHPKGNQSWIFIGRTGAEAEILIPDVKRRLIWKDPDAGKDWRWEEKGTTEDEIVGWHHRLSGHEAE